MRSRASSSVCPWPPRRYRATSSRARTAWVMSSSITGGNISVNGERNQGFDFRLMSCLLLDLAANRIGKVRRRCGASEIVSEHLTGTQYMIERGTDPQRVFRHADVIEQHQRG